MTTTKIKLLYRTDDYPNFTQTVIGDQVQLYFDMVPWDPTQTYNKQDTVILAMYWAAKQPETAWWYSFQQQGFKIIVDHLYDSDVDCLSRVLDANTLELRCTNWSWYNSALHYERFGYHKYQPQKNITQAFLMLLNKVRPHKDRAAQDLTPVLDQALWSYVDRGKVIESVTDSSDSVIWYLYMNPAWYNSTAFSVVVESWMRSDPWFAGAGFPSYRTEVSEKIFKPLAFYHPFICYGSEGTCRYLRREGFETFDNLWSEHYDTIASDAQRFEAVTPTVIQAVRDHGSGQFDLLTQQKLAHNHAHFFNIDLVRQRIKAEVIDVMQEFV
jgi:hypothetical protein